MRHFTLLALTCATYGQTQNNQATTRYQPTTAEVAAIGEKAAKLKAVLPPPTSPLYADVAVYHKAAEWILRYPEEFFTKAYVPQANAVLDRGLARAAEAKSGNPSWTKAKGRLSRGYVSKVDGSLQPYAMLIPASYDPAKPARLDVVLHGRGATLNEVSFLASHDSDKPVPGDQLQLEVYGRANNAYRWAGEADVFEALAAVRKLYNIDPDRIVLRGFSMGGAGVWHIGLHYPSMWAAIEAGAGFTETLKYAKVTAPPDYQRAAMHIYDAADYAPNVSNVPTVGYGGEIDPQLQGSVNIKEALAAEGLTGLRALFLVGPQTAHKFHPDSKKESDAFIDAALPRKKPTDFRFVTFTPRYGESFGVKIVAMERQYERSEFTVRGDAITTKNVARLELADAKAVSIDDQRLRGRVFERVDGKWKTGASKGLRKVAGLQGPVDDAFLDSFLCVKPAGGSHPRLTTFAADFAKWMRGDVPVKDAASVSAADIASSNLVLFGDPASNALIAKVAPKLPVKWTADAIELGGKSFDAKSHTLVMIYPNPLNPARYVVLNSGHTMGQKEFMGTNALLYPRLGDYAVIETATGTVKLAGLFDESWRVR